MAQLNNKFQSPLGRARGLGASHHGVGHWWLQKVTAISNIGLMGWLIVSFLTRSQWDYVGFTTWLSNPCSATLMILAIISVYYHAALGTQVVVEDYVPTTWKRFASILALKFVFFALATVSIVSVLKIAFV
jgi:succinate dehydrogenase / fumarate reductase membrane anchor subunit